MPGLEEFLKKNPEVQPSLQKYLQSLSAEDRCTVFKSAQNVCFEPALHFAQLTSSSPMTIKPLPDLGGRVLNICGYPDKGQQSVQDEAFNLGKKLLEEGKVAALIMAGGQATRLGASVPKGVFPINFGERAGCLLEILIRRVHNKGHNIPIIILLSPATEQATKDHLREKSYFGYPNELIFYCTQDHYPAFSADGKILLAKPLEVFSAPNGNAGFLRAMMNAKLLKTLSARGVEFLHIVGVDNPLIPLCDELTVGFAKLRSLDILNRVIPCQSGKKEGIVGVRSITQEWQAPLVPRDLLDLQLPDQAPSVLEYSELPSDYSYASQYANIMNHVLSLAYLERVAGYMEKLDVEVVPYHIAIKSGSIYDYENKTNITLSIPSVYKIEHFIFDIFHFCPLERFGIIISDRATDFSPIKNAVGEDSVESARQAYHSSVKAV
ncbi:UDP-N-acetylglucosamine pyrophosphorylase [Giardia duodenalis]|uniref:UDP-N-acetylglucosamine diphosphorylase n=2 Tax=Giardia intestinalis TaxID=5741 RepID=E2RTS8_GIAIC|nr:UDP-N-acetylglucosamine pyrophosphorylase [Giardia intestinalis]AAM54702.1 UDP-N-acetylglucosamine pyrophosphorylase [Giardia intestinalis]AAO39051.1 UDP-N-acetylglucosamine pyrophosphorylase [Giardia intestinalis]KAE8302151.1 UDP-N-acetylglucosamine pyrophosphorylase [Giardia intestinalis]|eukprot:XP_001707214.1 UDP-N-acetylglucosamine pyrophosphorylase [Giardia lamblia ATCC 50803]